MSEHDPLCQWANTPTHRDRADSCPRCYLIARVRADERERIAQAIEAQLPGKSEWTTRTMQACARIARNGGSDE